MKKNNLFFIKPILHILNVILVIYILQGCTPSAPKLRLDFHTGSIVNPDINGNTSPITIYIFELRNKNKFEEADFISLTEDASKILGRQYIDQNTIELTPASRRTLTLNLPLGTRYLGFAAGFQALEQSTWKEVIAVSEKTKSASIVVRINKNTLSVEQS